jgi:hypothetical protein
MTQQIYLPVAASHLTVALVWPYTMGLNGFQAILLLLQQNKEYEVVHILDI